MMPRVYRLLLHLLPHDRRTRHGADMTQVFEDLCASAHRERGALGVAALWMRETSGLIRFAVRDRTARLRASWHGAAGRIAHGRGPDLPQLLRWAWRGVRARGGRAWLAVLLVAVALSANAVLFSVADSLVFDRVPFRDADRLVTIQTVSAPRGFPSRFLTPAQLDEWRKQTDLFAAVHGYLTGWVFFVGRGPAEMHTIASITPGLIEMLGASPGWGRSLEPDDARQVLDQAVLIGERLARRRFGLPTLALGQRIETAAQPLHVVGVMRSTFAFPSSGTEIWRALDPRGPLASSSGGVTPVARIAPGVSPEALDAALLARGGTFDAAAGVRTPRRTEAVPLTSGRDSAAGNQMLVTLLAAAACLLLIACANVLNLEVAATVGRARTFAVQLALGASRQTLATVAALEGVLLVGASLLVAAVVTLLTISWLQAALPSRLVSATLNPLAFGTRTGIYMLLAGGVTWMLASLPVVFITAGTRLQAVLALEGRSSALSRAGVRLRQVLTVVEVALAVPLVVGTVLYTTTYVRLLEIDKGFDSRNLLRLEAALPKQYANTTALTDAVIARLHRVPGFVAATKGSPPPSTGNSPSRVTLDVDGKPVGGESILFAINEHSRGFFETIGLPLVSGRWFTDRDPPTAAILPRAFARRYWPSVDAVGHTFTPSCCPAGRTYRVVGVVADFRADSVRLPQPTDEEFFAYTPPQPPPPAGRVPGLARPGPPRIDDGGMYRFAAITVRTDSPDRFPAMLQAAQGVDPHVSFTMNPVDDLYAAQYTATLLVTRVVSAFGGLALMVAVAGVYGVMTFLVVGRTREIGIRMALGAGRRDISRLVLGSSLRVVLVGVLVGGAAAAAGARLIASQLFDVSPTEPAIYAGAIAVILAAATLATWSPARRAARIDPAVTLRAE